MDGEGAVLRAVMRKGRRGKGMIALCNSDKAILIPLGAGTVLPCLSTEITELFPAPAGHVEASDTEFDETMTSWATFPAFTRCEIQYSGV